MWVQLIPNGHTQAGFDSGALCLATMATLSLDAVHKTNMQYMLPALKFWFFAKIGSNLNFLAFLVNT